MKKLVGLWCVVLCMIFSMTVIYAEPMGVDADFEALAQQVVKTHLTALDLEQESGAYDKVKGELREYLKLKEAVENQYVPKSNYEITTSIVEAEVMEYCTYYVVNAQASWRYDNATVDSGYGRNLCVLIDHGSGEVVDLYDRMSFFDIGVRGEIDIRNAELRFCGDTLVLAQEKYGADVPSENDTHTGGVEEPSQVSVAEDSRFPVGAVAVVAVVAVVFVAVVVWIVKKKK